MGENHPGNPKVIADLLIRGNDGGNLLAVLLVHQLPVLLLAGFTAVLNHLALLALPQGGQLLRLPPVKGHAVDTFVQQARQDLLTVRSSHPFQLKLGELTSLTISEENFKDTTVHHAFVRKANGAEEECRRQGIAFLPLVAETFGGWHSGAEREVKKLGAALARHTGQEEAEATSHLWGRLGILLQRGNAAILGNRVPALPGAHIDGIL